LQERLHDGVDHREVVDPGVARRLPRELDAIALGDHVASTGRRLGDGVRRRRERLELRVCRRVDRALFSDEHTESFLRPRHRRELVLHPDLRRRALLGGAHRVEPVAHPSLQARRGVLLVRARRVERACDAVPHPPLRDDGQVGARRPEGDLAAHVTLRGTRHPDALFHALVARPRPAGDERNRELQVSVQLALERDDPPVQLAIVVEPRVRGVRVQRRQPSAAGLLQERFGPGDVVRGDLRARIARQRPADRLVEREADGRGRRLLHRPVAGLRVRRRRSEGEGEKAALQSARILRAATTTRPRIRPNGRLSSTTLLSLSPRPP